MQYRLLLLLTLLLSVTLFACGDDNDDDPSPDSDVAPSAEFTSTSQGCLEPPCTFSFSPLNGSATGLDYRWEFHDGEIKKERSPSKVYTEAGTYSVTLTVTSESGATDTETQTITVNAGDPPVADFILPDVVCLNECYTAFRNASQNADAYQWNFGDGNTSTLKDPDHEYAQPGTYDVTLTATANDGRSDQITRSIDVTYDNRPPCVANNSTRIEFVCTSDNPYDVYVNNTFVVRLNGGTSQTYTFNAGFKNLRAEQVSGYVFTPTIAEATVAGEQCKAYQWVFPD